MGRRIVMTKPSVPACPKLQPFSSYCIPQPAKDLDVVLLSYCPAWRSILLVDNTFTIKKIITMAFTSLLLGRAFFGHADSGDFHWEDWAFVSGS